MWIQAEQMRPSVIPKDFIGKGLKRFIFWSVLISHTAIFILPFGWYVLNKWLTPPPPKAIAVTLVSNPTSDPQSSRGTRAATKKGTKPDTKAIPDPGSVSDVSDNIPDVPDVPDVPNITPRPRPVKPTKTTPVVEAPPSKSPTGAPKPSPAEKPSSKKTLTAEDIQKWRKEQGGKTIKVAKKNTGGSPKGNSNQQTMQQIAKDIESMIGNGGTGEWGAGGQFDEYIPFLIDFIQREWKRQNIKDMGMKIKIPLYFEVDGQGYILKSSVRKPCGVPVVDAAVEAMLRKMQRLPAPPDKKRQSFNIILYIGFD